MANSIRHLVLLAAVAIVIAACGDGGATATSVSTTAAPPETVIETSSTTLPEPGSATTTMAPTTTEPASLVAVDVYFSAGDGSDCAQVEAFPRHIAESADPIVAAFNELVAGPNLDELTAGAGSFFSTGTGDAVVAVELVDGALTVDLRDYRVELSNASSSCGSASFLASLNATAFQFDAVEVVRYQIFGSCNVFYEFLQRECQDQTRAGPVIVGVDTNAFASGSGCTPGTANLPDGEWFGYVASATADVVEFDLGCWFTGAAAADAASEDGEESPPPNDYYIRNVSSEIRAVPAGEVVAVTQLATPGGPDTMTVTYAEWVSGWNDRVWQPGVWLTVADSVVTAIVEQYQP